jgi:hypothetical protein
LELTSKKNIKFSKDYISHQKEMKGIILNDYMQNIYFGFDEIFLFLEKGVMDNNYNCN